MADEVRLIDANALKENIQSCDCYVLSPTITSVLLYMIDNQPTVEAITREQYHDMTERFFDEFVDNGANESGDSNA